MEVTFAVFQQRQSVSSLTGKSQTYLTFQAILTGKSSDDDPTATYDPADIPINRDSGHRRR